MMYIIAVIVAMLLGFVWNLWEYSWLPILLVVAIDLFMKRNNDSRSKNKS